MNTTAQNLVQDLIKPEHILAQCKQLVSFDKASSSHPLIQRFGSPEQPIYADQSSDALPIIMPIYNGQLEHIQSAVLIDGEMVALTIDGENQDRGLAKGFAKYGDFHHDKPILITHNLEAFFKVAQTGYAVALVLLPTLCSNHKTELKPFDFEQIQFVINLVIIICGKLHSPAIKTEIQQQGSSVFFQQGDKSMIACPSIICVDF